MVQNKALKKKIESQKKKERNRSNLLCDSQHQSLLCATSKLNMWGRHMEDTTISTNQFGWLQFIIFIIISDLLGSSTGPHSSLYFSCSMFSNKSEFTILTAKDNPSFIVDFSAYFKIRDFFFIYLNVSACTGINSDR